MGDLTNRALNDAANLAIKNEIRKKRPDFRGSWFHKKPNHPGLNLAVSTQAWLGFVGQVKARYQGDFRVHPKTTAGASEFSNLKEQPLSKFRDRLVSKTNS